MRVYLAGNFTFDLGISHRINIGKESDPFSPGHGSEKMLFRVT